MYYIHHRDLIIKTYNNGDLIGIFHGDMGYKDTTASQTYNGDNSWNMNGIVRNIY